MNICTNTGCNRKTTVGRRECATCASHRLYGKCSDCDRWARGKDGKCRIHGPRPKCITPDCQRIATGGMKECAICFKYRKYGICSDEYCEKPRAGKDQKYCLSCRRRNGAPRKHRGRYLNTTTHKWCPRCQTMKPRIEFYTGATFCIVCARPTSKRLRTIVYEAHKSSVLQTSLGRCCKCWQILEQSFHADHILPVSLGGTDSLDNMQILCETCNIAKHNRESIDYRVWTSPKKV